MATRDSLPSILAVDDEPQILTAIEDLLEDDYIVIRATDPLRGLEALEQHAFSVILSDQMMPTLTGDEFLARARKISNASRVLVTGYTDIRAAQRAVNHGKIFAYVSKPWDPANLKKIVDEAAQHYQFVRDLQRNQQRKLSLEAARAGIWSWDPHAGRVFLDEAMQRLYGLEDHDHSDGLASWTSLIHADDRTAFEDAIEAALENGAEFDVTFRAKRSSDWRYFRAQAITVRDEDDRVARLTGLCLDVTEQKEAETQLRRYAQQLQAAQQAQAAHIRQIDRQNHELELRTRALDASNAELKNFAAVAAHDLKEPLRTIGFHMSLLEESLGDSIQDEARNQILTVRNLSSKLSDLIDAILNYMRLGQEEVALVPRSLQEVLEGVISVLQLMLKEESVELIIEERLPTVLCAPDLIGEVFHNLIRNSVKYNDKPNKRIEIGVEPASSAEAAAFVQIRVSDNGIGIDPSHHDRVFQMFRRLHGRGEFGGGTGVGLTLVKRIVELHRGRIWIDSTPGEGSTFRFTLGRAAGP